MDKQSKPLSEEAILKAMAEFKRRGIKVAMKPTHLVISPAAKAVADSFGVSVPQLFHYILELRERRYRNYMRNYMRKYRRSKKEDQ